MSRKLDNDFEALGSGMSLLKINGTTDKEERKVVVDEKWVSELKHLHFNIRYRTNRCDIVSYLKCTDGKWHYITIGKVVSDLESGKVEHVYKGMIYPYDDKECHHKYCSYDNRADSLLSLTKEDHRKLHTNRYGGTKKSHIFKLPQDKKAIVALLTSPQYKQFFEERGRI